MAFDLNTFNSRLATLKTLGRLVSGLGPAQATPYFEYRRVSASTGNQVVKIEDDWRVRVSLPKDSKLFYNSSDTGLLDPLKNEISDSGVGGTLGVIFPYTPSISVSFAANYETSPVTHSNYQNYFYRNSEVQAITISGDFTVQNIFEGQYLLAAIYFFRASSKMFFGQGANAGNPPPILFLDGYGAHYFPHVPCVLTNFTHTLPPDVDYVPVPSNNLPQQLSGPGAENKTGVTRLPTSSTVQITLQPIYSRALLHEKFDLEAFARGDNLTGVGKPGFL